MKLIFSNKHSMDLNTFVTDKKTIDDNMHV